MLVREDERGMYLELVCHVRVNKNDSIPFYRDMCKEGARGNLRRLWDKIYGGELLVRFNRVADFVQRDIALREKYADYTIHPIIQDVDTIRALLTTPLPAADDALARACVLAEQTNPQPKEHKT
jgi:hypothetical protein